MTSYCGWKDEFVNPLLVHFQTEFPVCCALWWQCDKFKDVDLDVFGAMVVTSGKMGTDSMCAFLVFYVKEMGIETLCDTIPSFPYILFVAGGASDTIDQV